MRTPLFPLFSLLLLIMSFQISFQSCVQSTSSGSEEETTQESTSSSSESSSESSSSGVSAEDPGVTYYDEEDEQEETTPGTSFSDCGVLYKIINDSTLRYKSASNTLYKVQEYGPSSPSAIAKVKLGNSTYGDAYNVCLTGYTSGTTLYLNNADFSDQEENPSKIYKNSYAHEFCGYMAHTNYGHKFTHLISSGVYYKINNRTGHSWNSNIPTVETTISSSNAIEACVYSNSSHYKDYSESFYSNIDVQAIDLGSKN